MLYHFQLELSDIDRGLYESLDFRAVQHPSEVPGYLLSRTLAFALSYHEGLAFSPAGLGDPDTPALWAKDLHGNIQLWIEIGTPSARKLHKAGKAAQQVVIYTYKNPELVLKEISDNEVHRATEIKIFAFDPKFLLLLAEKLQKNNRWSLLLQQGQLDVGINGETFTTDVKRLSLN